MDDCLVCMYVCMCEGGGEGADQKKKGQEFFIFFLNKKLKNLSKSFLSACCPAGNISYLPKSEKKKLS